jgi:hypothetical protein
LRGHLEWLDQGDVFARAPIPRWIFEPAPRVWIDTGGALLLTYGCQLDKPDPIVRTKPRIEALSFAPLQSLASTNLTEAHRGQLRRGEVGPYPAVYVVDAGGGQESYADLRLTYYVPASYFALELRDFIGHEGVEDDSSWRAVSVENDSRVDSLDAGECQLLTKKLTAFWTGQMARDPAATT